MTNEYVPTLTEIWDFLVGLKDATESGFNRLSADVGRLSADVGHLSTDVGSLKVGFARMESDLGRIERRVVRIEAWNINERLDDHERRLVRLEQLQQ